MSSIKRNAGQDEESTFTDLMQRLAEFRPDWQTVSSKDSQKLLRRDNMDHYIEALEHIEQLANNNTSPTQQATSIPGRVKQLFYQIHMSYLKASVYRIAALLSSRSTHHRIEAFSTVKDNLTTIIQSFMTLKQLSPIPSVAWGVQQATMSSALILASPDRALENTDSLEILTKLCRILPHCYGSVAEEETEKMMAISYCYGLEALVFILQQIRERMQE